MLSALMSVFVPTGPAGLAVTISGLVVLVGLTVIAAIATAVLVACGVEPLSLAAPRPRATAGPRGRQSTGSARSGQAFHERGHEVFLGDPHGLTTRHQDRPGHDRGILPGDLVYHGGGACPPLLPPHPAR